MSDPFAHIVGHEVQKRYLRTVLLQGEHAHAYLFHGPNGIGKKGLALAFAAGVLKIDVTDLNKHADVFFVSSEEGGKIGVEEIRAFKEKVSMTSFGAIKIGMIFDAHLMTISAQNALLKTLEEPSGSTLLIATAPSQESLLPTVVSRMVSLRCSLVPKKEVYDAFVRKGFERDIAKELTVFSRGRPLRAQELEDKEERDACREGRLKKIELVGAPIYVRMKYVETLVKESEKSRETLLQHVAEWKEVLHDMIIAKTQGSYASQREEDLIKGLSLDVFSLVQLLARADESEEALRSNVNLQLALEHMMLRV